MLRATVRFQLLLVLVATSCILTVIRANKAVEPKPLNDPPILESKSENEVQIPPALQKEYEKTKDYNLSRMGELMRSHLKSHPVYRNNRLGKLFRGVWTGSHTSWEWGISNQSTRNDPSVEKVTEEQAKQGLDGKWLHIQGDSTSRQLFNSLVTWLAPTSRYRAVRKNDLCYLAYSRTRTQLLAIKPVDEVAMEENHLQMCRCRKGLLFWDTKQDKYFTKAKDGFDFRITYSYKEYIFDDTDVALLKGQWPEVIRGKPTGRNLYKAFSEGLPDMWITNSGGHSFHLRPGLPLSAPDDAAIADYAHNVTLFTTLIQNEYFARSHKGCVLWRTSNVPPTDVCPPQHMMHANHATVPAMLLAGLNVIDVEDLSRFNRLRPVSCNIHSAPQKEIAQLTATALVRGCS
eukprot:TRINITY_DN1871_c0_g1_i1.p1 TRINITY_DN1871_c0_g1~~TRINITY_DN1871_c0_g1_i1.p1  ORF type:complete len:403 (+),score=50.72 TRINITY_DN1871_c0_g1_i1:50-1258(+)